VRDSGRGRLNRIIEVLLQSEVMLRRKNLHANNSTSQKKFSEIILHD
jgi:hypothetical protein